MAMRSIATALLLVFAVPMSAQSETNLGPAPSPPPAVSVPAGPAAPPPYEDQLLRLAEILGAVQYLRQLCKSDDGDVWRQQMQKLIDVEQPDEERRARMVDRFNHGYGTYRSVYLECTAAAVEATGRYLEEGARITTDITARYGR
jgi:uncharacterized protein (TIGR02301 family)